MISHGSRSSSRSGTRSRCTSTPTSRAISDNDDASPAAPQSWSERTRSRSTSSSETSISALPRNGSPICTDGRFSSEPFEILGGEHRRAADPVAAGERAVEHERVPRPLGAGAQDPLGGQEADAHRVHERVGRVRLVECALAADVRYPDAVAVAADAGDCPAKVPVGRAEPQAVEQSDRPRAHRHDVAENPADSGRCALERLDRRRVVVGLGLEGHRDPVAEVDHPGVLARALQDALTGRGQPPEQARGVLVAAVLGPEEREDRQLEVVRRSPEQCADTIELPVGETEPRVKWFRDRAQGSSVTRASDGPGRRRPAVAFNLTTAARRPFPI